MSVLPQVSSVSEKRLKSFLFKKAFLSYHILYPVSPWYWTWQWSWNDDFFKLDSGGVPESLPCID